MLGQEIFEKSHTLCYPLLKLRLIGQISLLLDLQDKTLTVKYRIYFFIYLASRN